MLYTEEERGRRERKQRRHWHRNTTN